MKTTDVIIIGAGATGLMAAHTLIKAGKKVTVLEARNRVGGRIHTVAGNFTRPVELGAEFVHGNLPVTLNLLEEAGIKACTANAEMWQYQNGQFEQNDEFIDGLDKLLDKLDKLEHDMPVYDFLEQNFPEDEFAKMRSQITNFISGYDTANVQDASAFALRTELTHDEENDQYRPDGGYLRLIEYLADTCRNTGNNILLNTVVTEVVYKHNYVKVITDTNITYEAKSVIFALPLGVLKAPEGSGGSIQFTPTLPEYIKAFKNIGFGAVIKILLEFDEIFWKNDEATKLAGAGLDNMGYLFTEEEIPTYWTQAPEHMPLLTGWIGGPAAYAKKDIPDDVILQETLQSLSSVFKIDADILKRKLKTWHVANWTADTFTRGSYAYDMANSPEARIIIQQPVQNKLYFAGEYLYHGPAMGTVEAALTSGKQAALKVLNTLNKFM